MPFDPEDNTFLLAGPVKMHPRVLRAMAVPALAHRDAGFMEVNKRIRKGLQAVFQTEGDVALISGSGSAGMEAAAVSILKTGEKAVALDNGKFGNRFVKLAGHYGDVTTLTAPWGQPVPLEEIERALRAVRPKALFLTHNESSVGFTHPLEEIAALCREHDALVVADCITSVGGMDVPFEDWGLDVAVVGSQKCLGAPAGLSAVAVSAKARAAMHKDGGFYLNLPKYLDKLKDGDTPFTPAIPLHLALAAALDVLEKEGLAARVQRVRRQAEAVRAAFDAMGVELFPEPAYASDTVTALRYPTGVEDGKFRKALKEKHGVVIAGGQEEVKGKIFRVGHMGTVSTAELAGGMAAIEQELAAQGAPIKRGAWAEAFWARA